MVVVVGMDGDGGGGSGGGGTRCFARSNKHYHVSS